MPTSRASTGTAKRRTTASSARSRKTVAPRQRDAITILRADHKLVDELFKQYEKTRADTRKQTLSSTPAPHLRTRSGGHCISTPPISLVSSSR